MCIWTERSEKSCDQYEFYQNIAVQIERPADTIYACDLSLEWFAIVNHEVEQTWVHDNDLAESTLSTRSLRDERWSLRKSQ